MSVTIEDGFPMAQTPKDIRSTGRKRARKVLFELFHQGLRPFACSKCGWTPEGVSDDGWEVDFNALDRSNNLDANHKNKNKLDNDPANLEWLCRTCHKEEDSQTGVGESKQEYIDEIYGEGFFDGGFADV